MRRIPLWAALCALLACSCSKEVEKPVIRTEAPDDPVALAASVFVPGQINVYFDDELVSSLESGSDFRALATKASVASEALEELGIVECERVFPIDEENEARHREFGLHRWYRVRFEGDVPSPAAAERFSLMPGVLSARPVHKVRTADENCFNDPMEGRQWGYHNPYTTWADVNAVPVWKNYTRGSDKVIVSVVDGGIDLTHEDLAAAVVAPGDNGSRSFMNNGNAYRITAHSHGTHVAGTIGAVNNNGKGVSGLAGGSAADGEPGVRLMSCQVFSNNDKGANFEAAIVWGADHGAVISNNSWGYDFVDSRGNYNKEAAEASHNFYIQPNSGAYKDATKDAIDYFTAYAGMKNGVQTGPMAGGLVVFAAGNDGRPFGAPSCYPVCLTVGAITPYGGRSNFSNYGSWVDICAPGVDILSTYPDSKYGEASGTSMACPHVSGVAALVVSYCGGMGFTSEQLRDKLVGGANSADIPSSFRIGPLVDALGAIAYGTGEPPARIENYTVDKVLSNNVTITFPVPPDRDGKPAHGVRVLASESLSDLEGCDPRSPGSNVLYGDILCRDAGVGDSVTGTIGDLGFDKSYYLALSSFDYGRNFSELSSVSTAVTGGNHAPVITTTYEGDFRFHVQDRFNIVFTISDEDMHVVNVEFNKDEQDPGALTLLESVKSGEYRLQVLGVAAPAGKYTGVLLASDNYGLSTQYKINYEILPNEVPVVKKPVDDVVLNGSGEMVKINMEDYIVDPDGEVLSYDITISDNSVVHVTQNSGSAVLNVTALADSGLATVTLSATDAGGATVSTSFNVLVNSGGKEVLCYPNPVVDILHVGIIRFDGTAKISLFNSTGARVYSVSTPCNAFQPAEINMRTAGPGLYTLKVEYGDKVFNNIIVKK